jgi:hypothetical protein
MSKKSKSILSAIQSFYRREKEEYQAENPDTTEDFQYQFLKKSKFDQSSIYKDNKIYTFQKFTNKFEIEFRKQISYCRRIKELINPQENIKDTLKHFNELRDRWKNAGSIPKINTITSGITIIFM